MKSLSLYLSKEKKNVTFFIFFENALFSNYLIILLLRTEKETVISPARG